MEFDHYFNQNNSNKKCFTGKSYFKQFKNFQTLSAGIVYKVVIVYIVIFLFLATNKKLYKFDSQKFTDLMSTEEFFI